MVENAIKQVREKVQTLVIAIRELHGVVMDFEHVALAWCVCARFHFPNCERRRWTHCISTCFSACASLTSHACSMERRILYLEASKMNVQITDKFLDGIFLGIKEGSEESIFGTPAGCAVCRTVKRRPRGTPRRLLPDDEPREPREPRERPLRVDVRPVHTDLPPPINTKPAKPVRVYIRNSSCNDPGAFA